MEYMNMKTKEILHQEKIIDIKLSEGIFSITLLEGDNLTQYQLTNNNIKQLFTGKTKVR